MPKLAIKISLTFLFAFVLTESSLRLLDPWGMRYFQNGVIIYPLYQMDPQRGFSVKDGVHKLIGYSMTIKDGARVVPDSGKGKTITFLGDSVTMGVGVDDEDTFVNLLARKFPNVRFVNAGVAGYNSHNVLQSMKSFPSDRYIYLLNTNDAQDPPDIPELQRRAATMPLFWITRYWNYFRFDKRPFIYDLDWHKERMFKDLEAITKSGNVTLVSFEAKGWILNDPCMKYFKIYPIRNYQDEGYRISMMDPHPDKRGHEFMAEELEWIVRG